MGSSLKERIEAAVTQMPSLTRRGAVLNRLPADTGGQADEDI
jgi:hypothetical protein